MASITPMSFFTPDASINPDEYTFEITDAQVRSDMQSMQGNIAYNENGATVEYTDTASKAYAVGEYLLCDSKFYKVTTAIAQGGTITPGTNVTKTNVGAEIANRTLWWGSRTVESTEGSSGTLMTITDARITADHILDKFVPADGNVITSGITCTTSAGQALITGTSTATTTAEIKLVKKDN